MGSRPAAGRVKGARMGHRKGSKMRRTWKGISRRSFVLGTAAAAVMAGLTGLTGCDSGSGNGGGDSTPQAPSEETQYFKSDYEYTQEGEQKLVDDEHALYSQLVTEGTVLLKNEGAALPLSPDDGKIMVFGNAGPQWMKGLDESFKNAGYDFDDACWEFYANGSTNVEKVAVNENPWSDVEGAGFLSGASGVAVVVLGRRGAEGSDCSYGSERDYLILSPEEKEMLNGVAELRRGGTFGKMIVLMNTTNFITWEDGEWSDAIDALVWCGSYYDPYFQGQEREWSVDPLVALLSGESSPSGRMPDSMYKDAYKIPAMVNFGAIDADRSQLSEGKDDEVQKEIDYWKPPIDKDKGSHWRRNIVYAESIYVGYRYYETRYEDKVLGVDGVGDFDYSSLVAYPFGYGLSYTTFEYSDFKVAEVEDGFDVTVKVTNTGDVEGKHSVTVYLQKPYTAYDESNGLEQSAIQLAGYEKSGAIAAGASEDVTVHVPMSELETYDSEGAKTYILEAGDYYLTIGNGSHEAVNNILAAKGKTVADGMTADGDADLTFVWNNPEQDNEVFATSVTGVKITNLFDDVDPNKNETMKEHNHITWLSRSNWEGTYPKEAIHLVYTDEVADMAKPVQYKANSGDPSSVPAHEFGKPDSDLMLVDMRGKDYDDPEWETLISKLTYEEAVSLIADDQTALPVIGKPQTTNGDGSNGRSTTLAISGLTAIPFPMTAWRTAAFDRNLSSRVGQMIGENLLHGSSADTKTLGLYGFSCNNHRTPYSGRNHEYYSEDPFLAGNAISAEVKGLMDKGGVTYMKHFAANDQETYRHGVPSWANEQTLREIYLKPFAKAMTEGHANGVMTGFNRLGMWWTGANPNLLKEFSEKEQGYRGITLTDAYETDFMNTIDGLLNGSHAWLSGTGYINTDEVLLQDDYSSDPIIQDAVFGAVHRILYVNANSLAMNGLAHDTQIGVQSEGGEEAKPAMVSAVDIAKSTGAETTASVGVDFYDDGTFALTINKLFWTNVISGKWAYDDSKGLELTADGGSEVKVEEKDGVYTFSADIETAFGPGSGSAMLSRYEFVKAANAAGSSFKEVEQPTYTVTYASGSDDVSGTDPESVTVGAGDSFTLPENPYEGQFMIFDGWDVNGTVMQPGDEVVMNGYMNYDIKGSWSNQILVTATTQDSYKYSFIQESGVPLNLYCNGTLRLNAANKVSSTGTWELEGSGSGAATLVIKNEKGEPVAAKVEKDQITYAQDGFYYDWGQLDLGWGSGVFYATYTHRIPVQDFLTAYNEVFGTSYETLSLTAGAAAFAEQEDASVPALGMGF